MRTVVSAIIRDTNNNVLVVDKPKGKGRVITILPGGKIIDRESHADALAREINEELGLTQVRVGRCISTVVGTSPTNNISTRVELYPVTIDPSQNMQTDAEVCNPRFLPPDKIVSLPTVTYLTKQAILSLITPLGHSQK